MKLIRRLMKEEDGQGYLEYAVLIALVVVAAAVAAGWIGGAVTNYMSDVSNMIDGL